ncbi:MAG: cell envelope integrity protein TolA [Pseudomonadota bacterium]
MYSRNSEPGKLPAGLLAVLVHLAFIALLVFGVTWRTKAPAPVMVDLWNKLPSPSPMVNPEEPPPPQAAEAPLEPQPLPPPKPKPKVEPAPAPKPDIALKEKEEKKKRLEAEKREQLEEAKRQQEVEKQEVEHKTEEARLKQEKLKDEQAKKLAAQREAQAKSQAERAAANAGGAMVASYMDRIRNKIEKSTQVPDTVTGRPSAEFKLVLLPTGELLSVTLVKSSGNPTYDDAVERGIKRAEPLPLPPDPTLFPRFRELELPFTHEN